MATEDLTAYTEVDPNSVLTVTAARATWASMTANEDAYVYKDKGAAHFAGNFEHWFESYLDAIASPGDPVPWALTNTVDEPWGIDVGGGDVLYALYYYTTSGPAWRIYLRECVAGTLYEDYYATGVQADVVDRQLYWKIVRDEGVGTYGTLYAYIYTDEARTTLLDTLSLALHEKEDFRYVFAMSSMDVNNNNTSDGWVQNLDLKEQSVVPLCDHHYRTRRAS